nr:hypothetical protein [Tanacetum cinerariifolium]
IATDEQAALSLLDLHKPKKKKDDTSANIVRDTSSPTDAKIGADTDKTNNEGDTEILNARSDLGKTLESRPPPEHVLMEKDQAGPNPGQSSDLENPLSSSGTLSSMRNLKDNFTFGDQFIEDEPTDEEPTKASVEAKAESMVTIPIHQASSIVPLLSTPVIDPTPLKPVSSLVQSPVIAITIEMKTTTLPLPPPLQQQRTTDSKLPARVSALEKKFAKFEQKNKTLEK